MNTLTLALALYAAFTVGAVCGAGLMCFMQAAKRRARLITARHLRRNDYGNRWSMAYPVSDPLERSGRIGGKAQRPAPWPEPPEVASAGGNPVV